MNNKLIGIKSSTNKEEYSKRLKEHPPLIEFFLTDKDFEDPNYIQQSINNITKEHPQIKITLHCPINKQTREYYNATEDESIPYIKKMFEICSHNNNVIGFIQHPHSNDEQSTYENFSRNIKKIREIHPEIEKYMFIENLNAFPTKKKNDLIKFLKDFNIKKVCFDTAHFSATHTEKEFYDTIKELKNEYEIYFHISDNTFKSQDTRPKNIGKGTMDIKKLLREIDLGIIETFSKDETKGTEIIDDYKKIKPLLERALY